MEGPTHDWETQAAYIKRHAQAVKIIQQSTGKGNKRSLDGHGSSGIPAGPQPQSTTGTNQRQEKAEVGLHVNNNHHIQVCDRQMQTFTSVLQAASHTL